MLHQMCLMLFVHFGIILHTSGSHVAENRNKIIIKIIRNKIIIKWTFSQILTSFYCLVFVKLMVSHDQFVLPAMAYFYVLWKYWHLSRTWLHLYISFFLVSGHLFTNHFSVKKKKKTRNDWFPNLRVNFIIVYT